MLPRSLRLFFQLLFVQYVVLAERMYFLLLLLLARDSIYAIAISELYVYAIARPSVCLMSVCLSHGWICQQDSYELQIWRVHSWGPSEQKPMKNLGERGAWAYPGTAQIF